MRIAAFCAPILIALAACSTTTAPKTDSPYMQPNQLMAGEIDRRIEQIPYLHGQGLVDNLYWLAQTGEQTLPAVLVALRNPNPKVRSSAAWVIGMIGDRRTIPAVQKAVTDKETAVRLECARTLVLLGDVAQAPVLIEGLDSDRKEVRLACHEVLKQATGHDFGYDHLTANVDDMRGAVLRWREWWGSYSGDVAFAADYRTKFHLGEVAAPGGEVQPMTPVPMTPVPGTTELPVQPVTEMPVVTPAEPVPAPVPANPKGS
jgi:hypothetical protein